MSTTEMPAPPPPTAPPAKRLVRLTDQSKIAGVAAGLGWYFGVDPTLIRIGLIVMTLTTGFGIPLYIVAWVLMPAARSEQTHLSRPVDRRDGRSLATSAIVIVVIAVIFGFIDLTSGQAVLAAILVGLGVLLFTDGRTGGDSQRFNPPTPPPGWSPPPPRSWNPRESGWRSSPHARGHCRHPDQHHSSDPSTTTWSDSGGAPQSAYEPYAANWSRRTCDGPSQVRRPRTYLGRLTAGLLLLLLGALLLFDQLGVMTATPRVIVGGTVAVAGVGLLIGAVFGRARWLIVVGTIGALVLVVGSAFDVRGLPVSGGVGDTEIVVEDVGQLDSDYSFLLGVQLLDLSQMDVDGQDVEVTTGAIAGEITVVVPANADVVVEGELGAGQFDILGVTAEGTGLAFDEIFDGDDVDGSLTVHVKSGVGELTVERDRPQ